MIYLYQLLLGVVAGYGFCCLLDRLNGHPIKHKQNIVIATLTAPLLFAVEVMLL